VKRSEDRELGSLPDCCARGGFAKCLHAGANGASETSAVPPRFFRVSRVLDLSFCARENLRICPVSSSLGATSSLIRDARGCTVTRGGFEVEIIGSTPGARGRSYLAYVHLQLSRQVLKYQ
jgi:hypothetical protein